MRHRSGRLATVIASVVVALVGLFAAPPAAHAGTVTPDGHGGFRFTEVQIPFGYDQWSYQQVAPGALAGFESPGFDDSDWPLGQAGFGNAHKPGCAYNSPQTVHTDWTPGNDMLLRTGFYIPGDPLYISAVQLKGTITQSADIYVNGVLQAHISANGCARHDVNLLLDDYDIDSPSTLAIRASGTDNTIFADLKLTVYGGESCDCFVATH